MSQHWEMTKGWFQINLGKKQPERKISLVLDAPLVIADPLFFKAKSPWLCLQSRSDQITVRLRLSKSLPWLVLSLSNLSCSLDHLLYSIFKHQHDKDDILCCFCWACILFNYWHHKQWVIYDNHLLTILYFELNKKCPPKSYWRLILVVRILAARAGEIN